MYETNYQNPVSRKEQALRGLFGSKKVLWISILGFVSIFLSIVSIPVIFGSFNPSSFIPSYAYNYEMEEAMEAVNATMPILSAFVTIAVIIASVPAILTAIAYLLFYLNAKKPEKSFKVPSTILHVLAIIGFICTCVGAGFVILILILCIALFSIVPMEESGSEIAGVVLGILTFAYAIILGVGILISFVQMRFTSSLKKSSTTPEISRKGVTGYSIVLMINAVSSGFSVLSALAFPVSGFSIGYSLLAVVSSGISIANYLLLFMFVNGFGKIIKNEEYARTFTNAPYNQAPNYNNPYTAPQEIPQPVNEAPVVEASAPVENPQPVCKQCGNAVNENDSFCMNCGSPIER